MALLPETDRPISRVGQFLHQIQSYKTQNYLLKTDSKGIVKAVGNHIFRRIERFFRPDLYKTNKVAIALVELGASERGGLARIKESAVYTKFRDEVVVQTEKVDSKNSLNPTAHDLSILGANATFGLVFGDTEYRADPSMVTSYNIPATSSRVPEERKEYNSYLQVAASAYALNKQELDPFLTEELDSTFLKESTLSHLRKTAFTRMKIVRECLEKIANRILKELKKRKLPAGENDSLAIKKVIGEIQKKHPSIPAKILKALAETHLTDL